MNMQAKLKLLPLFLLCLVPTGLEAAAGQVIFVKGAAQLERAGRVQPLNRGVTVEEGDLLITGADGRVQLRMADGDRMALRPDSRLRIERFQAPTGPDQPGTGVALYSLVKGGVRALTQSGGARDEASYQVRTNVATVGIRGTHYSLRLCDGDCDGQNGLYSGVHDGGIRLRNNAGELDLDRNQYGYVPDLDSPPTQLPEPPPLLLDNLGAGQGDGSAGDSTASRGAPVEDESSTDGPPPEPPPQTIEGRDEFGNSVDFTPGELEKREPEPCQECVCFQCDTFSEPAQ
jgi:hypothetical protein